MLLYNTVCNPQTRYMLHNRPLSNNIVQCKSCNNKPKQCRETTSIEKYRKNDTWTSTSWQSKQKSKFTPTYEDNNKLLEVKYRLKYQRPPLIFANEVIDLRNNLCDVCDGNSFIIQGGECAESVDEYDSDSIFDMFKTIVIMSIIISYSNNKRVIKILRGAGQYAKPRSNPTETRHGKTLPSYFGDSINSLEFNHDARKVDPMRMLHAHDVSSNTLNLLRSMSTSGYLSLYRLHDWINKDLRRDANDVVITNYRGIIKDIEKAINFMTNCGIDKNHKLHVPEVYTSHEALLLDYEEPMVRKDSITGKYFCTSGHFVWIGDRTRDLDGQHVEFLRGVENPIGIKISKDTKLDELIDIIYVLNDDNSKGKICLICRYGDEHIDKHFINLINAIAEAKLNVIFMIDPMHGNTYKLKNGYKTRSFDKILSETQKFFKICQKNSVYPGGIHLEMTGNDKSAECMHGLVKNDEIDVGNNYKSQCDPRLNLSQCIEYICKITKLII